MQTDLIIYGGVALVLIIGIIVAYNIKESDSDKVKGDKRLVAAIFIMFALVFLAYKLGRR